MAKPYRVSGGRSTKDYRHLYSVAKKRGLVKGDKDARSLKPTKYMRTKLNKLAQYLTDEYTTVKVKDKAALKEYREKPSDYARVLTGGNRVIVRRDPDIITRVRRGVITRVRRLSSGEIERVIIPTNPQSFNDFAREVTRNPLIEKLKNEEDDWFFRIGGNTSHAQFDHIETLLEYLQRYKAFIEDDEDDFEAFELYRVHGFRKEETLAEGAARKRRRSKRRKLTDKQREAARESDRKRRERIARDPAKLEAERHKQRERMAKSRERMTDTEKDVKRQIDRINARIRRNEKKGK